MARLARLTVAGQPHLIIQLARSGQTPFRDSVDHRAYLEVLKDSARECGVAVHAHALLNDQVRLLATPRDTQALGRFMQRIGRRYVPEFHRRHGGTGALWAGRFQSAPLDPERYLLPAILLIEQAPQQAGAVAQALDWPWSSAQHHTGRERNSWITEHPAYWRLGNTPFEREAKHQLALQQPLLDSSVAELLSAVRGGWPLGSPAFVAAIAQGTPRLLKARPRGRPRRRTTEAITSA
jgi:putative transposase